MIVKKSPADGAEQFAVCASEFQNSNVFHPMTDSHPER